ncbi:MAG: M64 family metallopeptidase [Opitutaceae bacterium]
MKPKPSHRLACLVILIGNFIVGSLHASDHTQWQLSILYHDDGSLELLTADPIPSTAKRKASQQTKGALASIPIRIQWFDANDTLLTSAEGELPLGIRVPIGEASDAAGVFLAEQHIILRIDGPDADQTPNHIVVEQQADLIEAYELQASESETPSAPYLQSPQSLTLLPQVEADLVAPPPGPISVTKIQDTGADSNRLVLVIVGDGYQESEITDGSYDADVQATLARFATYRPWDEMIKVTNVYQINVASNESGADYEDGAPETGTLKDTYFNTKFYHDGVTQRLLYPDNTGSSRAFSAANTYVGVGVWDQVIIVVNSTIYGGGGGSLATNSINSSGPRVSVHEVGHSFANLADEYFYSPATTYTGSRPTQVNVDTLYLTPKWNLWVDETTLLPTPDTAAYASTVGAFEGAKYNTYGIYRPWRSCAMRSLSSDFCPVCREQHLKTMFNRIDLIDDVTPNNGTTISVSDSTILSIDALPIDDIEYIWSIGGTPVASLDTAEITLTTAQLPEPTQTVSVTINYASTMMRSGAPSDAFSWTVHNTGSTPSGTPHWWLASYALGTTTDVDTIDTDGDGHDTRFEYLANTNPTDAGSTLEFTLMEPTPTGGDLAFQTQPDRRYSLHQSINLIDWPAVTGYESINGDGNTVEYSFPPVVENQQFFKIKVWIP